MAILKAGFTKGARGRQSKPSWGRRTSYLASEHEREHVVLYGRDGEDVRPLSRAEAVQELGGKHAQYRETIVSPSEAECRALEARAGGNKEVAQRGAAQGLGERFSEGRPYVVAVHEEGSRWHLHVAVNDAERPRMYGPQGEAQRSFDDYWRASKPRERIVDWDAHLYAKTLQSEARSLSGDLRTLERDRYQAVRSASTPQEKLQVASRYEAKARELVGQRHQVDRAAIDARHQSHGSTGSWEHKVDLERAQIRRAGGENRIQHREDKLKERISGRARPDLQAARSTDRTLAQGRVAVVRGTQRTAQAASRAASQAVRSMVKTVLPREIQQLARLASTTKGSSVSAPLALARSALAAHQALSVSLKAVEVVRGLSQLSKTLIQEIER